MTRLRIVGSSPWDDLYPNVKHRVTQLQSLRGVQVEVDVNRLEPKDHNGQGVLAYLTYGLRTVAGVLGIAVRTVRSRPDLVYVTYPTPVVLVLLRLLGVHRRSRIYADVFISISETLIQDRNIVRSGSLVARTIIALERFSLTKSVCIVDTAENAQHLARFLRLPHEQFQPCPLALAPVANGSQQTTLEQSPTARTPREGCAYFVGTFVPLQGVPNMVASYLEAEKLNALIPLIVRGTGQDKELVRQLLAGWQPSKLQWLDELASSEIIEAEIAQASLCVGIFGSTNKARRVVPFKIYQYLRAGKPILTLDTPALRSLEREFLSLTEGPSPFLFTSHAGLTEAFITHLGPGEHPSLRLRGLQAKRCFDQMLSDEVALIRLSRIMKLGPNQGAQ